MAYYNDVPESFVLDGWLLEPAELRDQYSLLRLRVDQLRLPEQGQALVVDGQLLVRTAPGVPWQYGDRLRLDVLAVTPRGAVLLLGWDQFRVLLADGMDFEALDDLLSRSDLAPLSALFLADSGYAPLNPTELFVRLQPQVVFLSVVAGNREGLPSPDTLKALRGYNLLRTDQNGWIELSTDGEQMWVEVQRK
jgi:hypothetical protein